MYANYVDYVSFVNLVDNSVNNEFMLMIYDK